MGIPLIGKTLSKDLANRFKTYNEFRKHINEGFDFSQIEGYGPEMTKALLTFNYGEMDAIAEDWLENVNTVSEPADEINSNSSLVGYNFVITGKLKQYKNRAELKAAIESRGGKVKDSITSLTSYLINNDINSTSSKNKKAKELQVPIITEEEFTNIFDI
jgi:DNA ligase (NAD+)